MRPEGDANKHQQSLLTTGADAKDWKTGKGGWPVEGKIWSKGKVIKEANKQADIGKKVGSKVEWHVPTKEKATELQKIFTDERIKVDVKVTPKNYLNG